MFSQTNRTKLQRSIQCWISDINQHTMSQQLQKMLSNGVRLYYKILKLHRKVLPQKMRTIGDYYVRQEFKHHHQLPQIQYYQTFYKKWDLYYNDLSNQGLKSTARHLNQQQGALLTNDQKQALRLLKTGIQKNINTF